MPQAGDAGASAKILDILLARDRVAQELEDPESPAPAPAEITQLAELDDKLKGLAVSMDAIAGSRALAHWRQSVHPIDSPWWWSLDERASASGPLWAIPAAIFFTLSISVLADTITTLRNGGFNSLSVFGTLIQTLLALLAGSAFLSGGREWLGNLFSYLGIDRKFRGASRVYLALGVLALTFGIRYFLPDGVARYRNHQGDNSLVQKDYFAAAREYQQAIALKPDFLEAQYHLGVAFDRLHDYPKAISQYELCINFNRQNYPAYNRLARLYILERRDPGRGLGYLNYLRNNFEKLPLEDRYRLYKNSGWAYLEQHNYDQAGVELEAALRQRDGAAARFLLGKVLDEKKAKDDQERQSNRTRALQQWDAFLQFVQYDSDQEEVDLSWGPYAQDQIKKGVTNENKTNP